jgi:hypothetical protein
MRKHRLPFFILPSFRTGFEKYGKERVIKNKFERVSFVIILVAPRFSCVAIVTAGFEALSDQVDNLTLPLLMYAGLVWFV